MLTALSLSVAALLLNGPLGHPGATIVAFPLTAVSLEAETERVLYAPRSVDMERLYGLQDATLTDVLLPDGTSIDLELQRVDLGRLGIEVFIDGEHQSWSPVDLSLSVWRGTVTGAQGSEAALSFSRRGSYGWIRVHDKLFHLTSHAGPDQDWAHHESTLTDQRDLHDGGTPGCATDDLPVPSLTQAPAPGSPVPATGSAGVIYEARVAIESDYQYFQVFGDTQAALAYMAPLFAYVSAQFEEQVGTILTYPYVGLYTTPADPWTTGDIGGDCIDMIYEFQAAWSGNLPAGADLGYFVSGASLGCGAGFIGGLCDEPRNFAVAGNQNGLTGFPVTPNNLNIDYYAATHEIGHTFNAIHTHDYCPPIDECSPQGYFGPCQTQQACTYPGTLMSYCHVCGGFGNIDTVFHPQSAADMRAWVETTACLPPVCPPPTTYCTSGVNSEGCAAAIAATGTPSLSGPDDFHVTASEVIANQFGLLFYGLAPATSSVPFGTLCVESPLVRTPVLQSGGSTPLPPCDGTLDFHWSQSFASTQGLTAGTLLYAQFWYRDPGSAAGSALTNALQFTLCP